MSPSNGNGRLVDVALSYTLSGLSIIPCHPAPKKSPVGTMLPTGWKSYQENIASEVIIRRWFSAGLYSVGLVCGSVSGNLEVIDFDAPELFPQWAELVEGQLPGLLACLPQQRTPRGGQHVLYRCPVIEGNQALARKVESGKTKKLIETKGEGGYVLCYPSSGYALLGGSLTSIPEITPDERAILIGAARGFNEIAASTSSSGVTQRNPDPSDLWGRIDQAGRPTFFSREDDIEAARKNLDRLAPWRVDDYDEWVRVGMALSELGPDGLNLWDSWSQHSSKYTGRADIEAKWDSFDPAHGLTLASLTAWANQDSPAGKTKRQAKQSAQQPLSPPLQKTPWSQRYIDTLTKLGYTFRLNQCTDSIEVNGEPITDCLRAEIRSAMRDIGLGKRLAAIEDAYITDAGKNTYHPVHAYLEGLMFKGEGYISALASFFCDAHGVFPVYLRRWLIGAVDKAYTGAQNPMLVMDGVQGIGKSSFARWLCPVAAMFTDSPIDPSNKDFEIVLISKWIWEVSELGATTRKSDRESLKAFLSKEWVTVRKPYDRYAINKPALASFVGTVNNESGILSDPTGNRRFNVCTLTHIDWQYAVKIDIEAVWAEAVALYRNGERGQLAPAEAAKAQQVNEEFMIDDPIEGFVRKYYAITGDLNDWLPTIDLVKNIQDKGYHGSTRQVQMELSTTMRRLGLKKDRRANVMGYCGLQLIVPVP